MRTQLSLSLPAAIGLSSIASVDSIEVHAVHYNYSGALDKKALPGSIAAGTRTVRARMCNK